MEDAPSHGSWFMGKTWKNKGFRGPCIFRQATRVCIDCGPLINDLKGFVMHEVLDGMVTPNVGVKLKTLMDVPTGVALLQKAWLSIFGS
jgi:hypothetical protein